jgi:Leucine Rich repeat
MAEQQQQQQQQQRQQQQQQRPQIHRGVLDGIARLADPRYRKDRNKLIVCYYSFKRDGRPPVDRQSLQHLVDFLDSHQREDAQTVVIITELELDRVRLSEPSDGGLQVLCTLFARCDTTLTKIALYGCYFGSREDVARLLAALATNRTLTDLTIRDMNNLPRRVALGNFLSTLMQRTPPLQRLDCQWCALRANGIRALQPSLQANRTLVELDLSSCELRDDGIRLLVDALVGNTTMELLHITHNDITSVGLADITRLLESTVLKTIAFLRWNHAVLTDEDATQHFVSTLQHKISTLHQLDEFMGHEFARIVEPSLTRNQQLNRVNNLLLVQPPPPPPPPPPPLPPPPRLQKQQRQQLHATSSSMMLNKIAHQANGNVCSHGQQ